ncbi:cation:proton antiporter [Demequina sp. SYSU T00039]|uniref:Cation:proton antiporter n=1 Tax=Demequina lignilytica TaxID=3051663 RepID=A0AAW7M0D5_9MICO|nr:MULTISPECIES: cation:proton antiporter [unclassified Demequina]MDN4477730.1 cation:proton antiporter [Demequina sp. SYSU T00039-1]MDN4487639.1 cation:proton antiporter [Demequina sp. SYSU T00039]
MLTATAPLSGLRVVAASPHSETSTVLIELGVVFLVLALLGRLASRIGIPSIPLYLLAGLIMGEGGFIPIAAGEDFLAIGAQIGVVLLLLLLGLEYSPDDLRVGLRTTWKAGILDGVANAVPGFAVGLLLGWSVTASILLAGVTYISSSGIIARLLDDFDRLANRETPVILSLLVMEDIVMAVFLPILAVLLVGATIVQGAIAAGIAIAIVAAAFFFALKFSRHVSTVVHSHSRELLLLGVLGLAFLVAGLAEAVQVSAAVGAFLLGLTLSGNVADQVRGLMPPLRDVFGGIFFVFFGIGIDPRDLVPVLLPALALALVTAVTKVGTGIWAARQAGIGPKGQWRTGLSLVPRGEFSIVIAGLGVAAGAEAMLGPFAAAYVLILAVAGSILMRFADRIPSPLKAPPRRGVPPAV